MTLGGIYQKSEKKNIEIFINEIDEIKLETFMSYKVDSIYHDCQESWGNFYERYKN